MLKILMCLLFLNLTDAQSLAAGYLSFPERESVNDTMLARTLIRERGEVYISFDASAKELNELARFLSIDAYRDGRVRVNTGEEGFGRLIERGVEFIVHPPAASWPLKTAPVAGEWDNYPSWDEYLGMMHSWASRFNDICTLIDAGSSVEGRPLLFIRISGNGGNGEPRPRFMYSAGMHGDETVGFVLMLRLIEYLLENYPSDSQVATLLDNLEIWINPLANPDGAYSLGNENLIDMPVRRNANGVDLNRNFPEAGSSISIEGRQPETAIMIELLESTSFLLSANLHGGEEVMNYPWDHMPERHADDLWFKYICREYADTAQKFSPPHFMTFMGGITNGYDWYSITGSRQDYVTYFTGGREVTMEISKEKHPHPDSLRPYWDYNYRSLLNYMEQAMFGVRGVVTDALSGEPVNALIRLLDHDSEDSVVESCPDSGWYFRMLAAGSYIIEFSAAGYKTETVNSVYSSDRLTRIVDVVMQPMEDGNGLVFNDSIVLFPVPAHGTLFMKAWPEERSTVTIELTSVSGSSLGILYHGIREPGENLFELDVSNFPGGVYILRIRFGSSFISRKILL